MDGTKSLFKILFIVGIVNAVESGSDEDDYSGSSSDFVPEESDNEVSTDPK